VFEDLSFVLQLQENEVSFFVSGAEAPPAPEVRAGQSESLRSGGAGVPAAS
jgi:hypothetical protein